MQTYLELVELVLADGEVRQSRTGVRTLSTFGHMLKFDMSQIFPIVTAKKVNFKSVAAELVGFLRGFSSAAQFRDAGTKIWDANANDPGREDAPNPWLRNSHRKGPDDLGRIYGVQWRQWQTPEYMQTNDGRRLQVVVDQIDDLLEGLEKRPYDRRHLVSAWNPGELSRMALPPCHFAFQCYLRHDDVGNYILDVMVHMRSVDVFLGLPFNISSYAALAHWICHMLYVRTGETYFPGRLLMTLGDTHIYENHVEACRTMLSRGPSMAGCPTLSIDPELRTIDGTVADSFILQGYEPHPALPAPMAV